MHRFQVGGAIGIGGVTKFNFFSVRQDPASNRVRKFAAITLVIGNNEIRGIAAFLNKIADDVDAAIVRGSEAGTTEK